MELDSTDTVENTQIDNNRLWSDPFYALKVSKDLYSEACEDLIAFVISSEDKDANPIRFVGAIKKHLENLEKQLKAVQFNLDRVNRRRNSGWFTD